VTLTSSRTLAKSKARARRINKARQGNVTLKEIASEAEDFLATAYDILAKGAYRGWSIYALIQWMKALADLGKFDELDATSEDFETSVDMLPILRPDYLVTHGQIYETNGYRDEARACYEEAIEKLRILKFPADTVELFAQYLDNV
jgi:tetratricopeptide (TPR) repeat protein